MIPYDIYYMIFPWFSNTFISARAVQSYLRGITDVTKSTKYVSAATALKNEGLDINRKRVFDMDCEGRDAYSY